MNKHVLKAEKRKIAGRKVKTLRKQGILPGNVYGKKIKSLAVQTDIKEFTKTFKEAGETGLVELVVGGENLPVLIHNVQKHPISGLPVHADFYQVNLKEKVTASVPLEFIGDAKAVSDKIGVLLTILSEVEVEALPSDLPEKIEIDVTGLSEIDQVMKIKDLKVSDKIKINDSTDLDIVKVAPLVSKEAEKMAQEEAAQAQTQAETQAATTGEEALSIQAVDEAKSKDKPKEQAQSETKK